VKLNVYKISFYNLFFFFFIFCRLLFFYFILYLLILNFTIFIEWELLTFNSCNFVITILIDWIRIVFLSFVFFISSLVIFYRKEYIVEDKNINRFIILVILFVFSIILLIISPNLIRILLGWDGLGLVSYCLVIYFQNIKSYNAGIITALSNRIGDVIILLRIAWILNFGRWRFIFYFRFYKNNLNILIIIFFIVIAAITKRAQIPFSSWLPSAIAAPTPVSALVHSSTLVTAGVYLLIRFNELICYLYINKILLIFSILTIFMSGLGANYEIDLKKIIALSTLRQLGLIIRILCLGFYKLAFFHLLTHALFKALLFLCAGSFIHNLINFQDIRLSGNFFNQIPLTSVCFNISRLSLCGIPFLTGFYSKDLILEIVCISNFNLIIFFLFFFRTILTVSYSFRLIFYISIIRFSIFSLTCLFDENWLILKIIFILTFLSIFGGRIIIWLIFPYINFIFIPLYLKFLTLLICFFGFIISYNFFIILKIYNIIFNKFFILIKFFFRIMWFIPLLSTLNILFFFLKIGKNYLKYIDFGWREIFGGFYITKIFYFFSQYYQKFQLNQLKLFFISYLIMIFLFLLLIYFYSLF